jgi:hypothetical protein
MLTLLHAAALRDRQIMIDQRRTMLLEVRRKENEEYERKKAEGVAAH